jgi:hypothetical protein
MIALNRRRGVGAEKQAKEYIQNGLVFWLDGIDKGDNAGYWTEKINGLQFPVNGGHITQETDGFTFEDGSDCHVASTLDFPYATHHIECVCTVNAKNQIVFMTQGVDNVMVSMWGNYMIMATTTAQPGINVRYLTKDMVYSLSYNTGAQYVNGVSGYAGTSNRLARVAGTIYLGRRSSGNYYTGKICSIRIYNRFLADEEIQNNYQVDKQRFGL